MGRVVEDEGRHALSACGVTMRLCLIGLLLVGCWPAAQCKVASVDIYPLGNKPKPAGKVVVGCDGKKLVEVEADEVK